MVMFILRSNGSAGEPWPEGPSVPSAGSTAAGGRNQRGSPADPFARPPAVGRTKIIEFRIDPQFFSIVWFVVCQLACFYNRDTGL